MDVTTTSCRIALIDGKSVSALLRAPKTATACFVFAHGAGAGMNHPFMANLAAALAVRSIATLRFQFPFMEDGANLPDSPERAQGAIRTAVSEAALRLPALPLFAGGKSFGAHMTSQAQADDELPGVRGLVFVGFPLHAAGKPDIGRAAHFLGIRVPMLFLQGTRDALADIQLIRQTTSELGERATLVEVEDADHSFHVLARSGRTDEDVVQHLADSIANWIAVRIR